MTINELDVLNGARQVLAEESAWTKGASALRADGTSTCASDPQASRFCVVGALTKATPAPRRSDRQIRAEMRAALEAVLPPGFSDVEYFNDADETTHAQVLDLLDRAARYVATGEK